jgi:PAS domain S-box-containing protein
MLRLPFGSRVGGRPEMGVAGRAQHSADAHTAWRALLEAVPAAFYVDRIDGTSLYVSPQIEGVIGCTQAEWGSGYDAWLSRIHPDDRARVRSAAEEFIRTGRPESDEYRVVLDDGETRWIHERAVLVDFGTDEEPLVHGVVVDVTPQRAPRELTDHVARLFDALVRHAGEAVTIVDEQGIITFQNPSMGKIVGCSPEWLAGRSPLELMHPDDARRARRIFADVCRRPGAQLPGEFRLRHRDGSWRIVKGLATNLLHDPVVRGILLNYRDVTEERRAEQRRRALLESMVRAENEQRAKIAEELHDDTIQVMTAALVDMDRAGARLDDGDVARARTMIRATRHTLEEAVDRTRTLTFELRPQLLEAAGLARAVAMLIHHTTANAPFEVELTADVGRYPEVLETLAYRTVAEALANVRKHAHAHSVRVALVERGGVLEGDVVDDGVGFDVGAALRATPEGLHFGLRAMLERIRIAGGSCDVDSAAGRGTHLRFTLPVEAPITPTGAAT